MVTYKTFLYKGELNFTYVLVQEKKDLFWGQEMV